MTASLNLTASSGATYRVLSLPLTAMGVTPSDLVNITDGLPAGAVSITGRDLIMAATSCDRPMFSRLEDVTRRHQRDVLLVRTGFFPETLDPVTVDLTLWAGEDVIELPGMIFCRDMVSLR